MHGEVLKSYMLQKRNTNVEQWAINNLNEPKFLHLLQVKGDHDELLEVFQKSNGFCYNIFELASIVRVPVKG